MNARLMEARGTESGFTLVELLVVIGIIAILTAIAVPMFLNQQKKSYDAALRSDIKNAATVLVDENMSPKKFYDTFNSLTAIVMGEGGVQGNPDQEFRTWNLKNELAPIVASKGTSIEIVVVSKDNVTWVNKHDKGEFCIIGTSDKSNFNYAPGSGVHKDYDKHLFYDSRMGGIKTMQELVEPYKNGEKPSCSGMVKVWLGATGG